MTWQYYEFMFSKDNGSRPEPLPDYYKDILIELMIIDINKKKIIDIEKDSYDFDDDNFHSNSKRNPFEDFSRDKSDMTDFGETDDQYPYSVFGLKRSNSDEDMKKAYREAIMKSHPDKGGDVEEFRMYRQAWEHFLL